MTLLLKLISPYFNAYCPGSELVTISFMNNIKADIVISTTPHLDIYMWKRSKNVKKYIHIFHSASGFDYAYLFQKPILLSTSATSFLGYEAEDLPEEYFFERNSIQYLGHELTSEEAENISQTVKDILKNKSTEMKKIIDFRNKNIYNFGRSGIAAADAIETIYKGLQK